VRGLPSARAGCPSIQQARPDLEAFDASACKADARLRGVLEGEIKKTRKAIGNQFERRKKGRDGDGSKAALAVLQEGYRTMDTARLQA
jgi:hypothetical protein